MMTILEKVLEQDEHPFGVLSFAFSNYERAALRQQRPRLAKLLSALSQSLRIQAVNAVEQETRDEWLGTLQGQIKAQLAGDYATSTVCATDLGERGALRALLWGKKVSLIQNALVGRFVKHGEAIMDGAKIHVCEACGFLIIKEGVPDLCPICKAPSERFVSV
jgi:rubrerythrin